MAGVFTYLDMGLVIIAVISGLLAMYRGLTREVLSLASWALAGAAGAYFVIYQKGIAQTIADKFFGGTLALAQAGGGLLIFLLFLILIHLLTARFSERVLDSRVGIIDRGLGFAFGLARGFLLVVIAFVFYTFLFPENKYPTWVKDAQSLPVLQQTGKPIQTLMAGVADYVTAKIGNHGQAHEPAPVPAGEDSQGTSG